MSEKRRLFNRRAMRADSIRPNVMGTARFGEWNQRPVTVLGFPRGEAKGKKPYALTVHPTAQSRQLRADAIRPYGYAAYHCGNLQVSFLKLHLFGNGAGEGQNWGRERENVSHGNFTSS